MNKEIKVGGQWPYYCYTEKDGKSAVWFGRWTDLSDQDIGGSSRPFGNEIDALNGAVGNTEANCALKRRPRTNLDDDMDRLKKEIFGKK